MIRFISITNDPATAAMAEAAGVERIFVDLEILGKRERQGHLDTLISSHSIDDVARVRAALHSAELIVRVNPLHAGSAREVDAAIEHGADTLMLPMFRDAATLAQFCDLVGARARVMPLVETSAAVAALDQIVILAGVSEVYIGLNDLHLDLGLNFMFEPLADGMLDRMVDIIEPSGLAFGFGGVARVGDGRVPGEMVLAEHARLGSSSVILSRSFNRDLGDESAFAAEVARLKTVYANLILRSAAQIESEHEHFRQVVRDIVRSRADEKTV